MLYLDAFLLGLAFGVAANYCYTKRRGKSPDALDRAAEELLRSIRNRI